MNRYRLIFAAVAVSLCASASAQTPLPEIRGVDDSANWIAAGRAGLVDAQILRNMRIQAQERALNQEVGDALSRGNYEEAANIAARGGNIDLYRRIKEMEKH